jgi:hypothetical protein
LSICILSWMKLATLSCKLELVDNERFLSPCKRICSLSSRLVIFIVWYRKGRQQTKVSKNYLLRAHLAEGIWRSLPHMRSPWTSCHPSSPVASCSLVLSSFSPACSRWGPSRMHLHCITCLWLSSLVRPMSSPWTSCHSRSPVASQLFLGLPLFLPPPGSRWGPAWCWKVAFWGCDLSTSSIVRQFQPPLVLGRHLTPVLVGNCVSPLRWSILHMQLLVKTWSFLLVSCTSDPDNWLYVVVEDP